MTILKFALLGVGRIGRIHAKNIALNSRSKLECIYDINYNSAKDVSNIYGGKILESPEHAINNDNVAYLDRPYEKEAYILQEELLNEYNNVT